MRVLEPKMWACDLFLIEQVVWKTSPIRAKVAVPPLVYIVCFEATLHAKLVLTWTELGSATSSQIVVK